MSMISLLLAAVVFQPTGERVIRVTDGDKSFLQEVPLAELRHAEKEPVALIRWNPSGWAMIRGTKLAAVRAMECTHPGSVVVPSVKVTTADGKALDRGKDWEIDPVWGVIGSLDPAITNVLVSYDYRLPKTVKIEKDGKFYGSVWLDPAKTALGDDDLFPLLEGPAQRPTGDVGGAKLKCPKSWAKLEKGERIRILAWGDSVTEMRYLPSESRWQRRFVTALKERFPKADIELVENGWSGRMTTSFINAPASDEKHHYQTTVLDVKPDLVVSEFVNDAAMDEKTFEATYPRILRDFSRIGAEWIIVAPHYVTPSWMNATSMKVDDDPRPFVKWERRFAAENHIALADTPLIWGHLWREGIPYQQFLLNGINHPDHESLGYFVEALMVLFRPGEF